jgi:hypothetical protein
MMDGNPTNLKVYSLTAQSLTIKPASTNIKLMGTCSSGTHNGLHIAAYF